MSNKIKLFLILRLIFILLLILLISYLVQKKDYFFTTAIIVIVIIYQIRQLFKIIDNTNTTLNNFLTSIEHMDFTHNYNISGSNDRYNKLEKTFDRIITKFRNLRRENEEQRLFLITIIKNLKIGLIIYEADFSISVINNFAKKILNINKTKTLNDLFKNIPELELELKQIPKGVPLSIRVTNDDEEKHLSFIHSTILQKGKPINILSIHDIQYELDKKEIESWQKLISVLTHEIMNSMTPIASMGASSSYIIEDIPKNIRSKYREQFDDIQESLEIISKRSKGLIHFVKNYRDLTKFQKPILKLTSIKETIDDVLKLFSNIIEEKKIQLLLSFDNPKIKTMLDKKLFEQVLINILKNSIDALDESEIKTIKIYQELDYKNNTIIRIVDSGSGIEKEALDRVFIPFFTTKQDGTGIGLSLSKQILGMLNGTIHIKNNKDRGITVKIKI